MLRQTNGQGPVLGTIPTAVASDGPVSRKRPMARCLIDTDPAAAVGHDVNEPTCHDQVLIEMDHVRRITFRQMHAEGSPQTDKSKQGGSPTSSETQRKGKPPDQVYGDRYPDRKVWSRHVYGGEIMRCASRVLQLENTIPDKQARHQQPREQKHIFLADPAGSVRRYKRDRRSICHDLSPDVKWAD